MKKSFIKELSKINSNRKNYQLFLNRLKHGKLTRSENPQDHFCSFFLPFNSESKSVYVGHHINSGLWLPPGGHIEENETPIDAVYREMKEELNADSEKFRIEPFNLSISYVIDKSRPCKIHYDFWYLIYSPKINFAYDKSEFYQADWYPINSALEKVTQDTIIKSLTIIKNFK